VTKPTKERSAKRRPRPSAAIATQQQGSAELVADLERHLKRMIRSGQRITFPAVEKATGRSHSFLYDNPVARDLVMRARERSRADVKERTDQRNEREEENWRQRALNAEDALRAAKQEIRVLRQANSDLQGQIRDPDGTIVYEERARLRDISNKLRRDLELLRREKAESDRALAAARANIQRLRGAEVARLYPNGPRGDTDPATG
jgi:hypothetical protein